MKKIFVLIPSLEKGGAERAVSRLSRVWSRTCEVKLFVFDDRIISYEFAADIETINLDRKKRGLRLLSNMCRSAVRFVNVIRHEKPDAILAFMEPANFFAIICAFFAGALDRTLVSVRSDPDKMTRMRRFFIGLFYNWAAKVVVVSSEIGRKLQQKYWIRSAKIAFIPNGIEQAINKEALREDRYVAVGRLCVEKGYDLLIKAYAKAVQSGIEAPLHIFGDGALKDDLRRWIKQEGVEGKVFLRGEVADVQYELAQSKVFLMSSRVEGWPNALLEAMSAGCACVSFNCETGPKELIEHEKSGLLVSPNDINEMAAQMVRVMSDSVLQARLSAEAKIRAQSFDINDIAFRWLEVSDIL